MRELRITVLGDGSSDRALVPILQYLMQDVGVRWETSFDWADFSLLPPHEAPSGLEARIRTALDLYPCNLFFIHRDGEGCARQYRKMQLDKIIEKLDVGNTKVCYVITITMLEAWLLINESAIRRAVGNPCGKSKLELPRARDLERIRDPKKFLFEKLAFASELNKRRQRELDYETIRTKISNHITDFSALNEVPAFRELKTELRSLVRHSGWNQ